MKDIKELREKINQIDHSMADLFEKRMEIVAQIAEYKKENALPVYDKSREDKMMENHLKWIQNPELKEYYIDYLKASMNISKNYQTKLMEGMKIAYCGVEGAFAHISSKKIFSSSKLLPFPSFESAYKAVENSECDACVLPLENSTAGDVGSVMDLIFEGSLYINNIVDMEISHNLIVKKGTRKEDIKKVCSHPQALSQCHEYIEEHGFEIEECSNTAVAAKMLSESEDYSCAVLASKEVAELYDLEVLERNVNQARNNSTRFAVFSKSFHPYLEAGKMGKHFILVFTVLNEAGALASTLNIIGAHGFNMRTLRSRPLKELQWSYYFFVELEGDILSNDGQDMIRELHSVCDRLKVVGTYLS